jgi:hypothetical protein
MRYIAKREQLAFEDKDCSFKLLFFFIKEPKAFVPLADGFFISRCSVLLQKRTLFILLFSRTNEFVSFWKRT